jgi:hypothetical protein
MWAWKNGSHRQGCAPDSPAYDQRFSSGMMVIGGGFEVDSPGGGAGWQPTGTVLQSNRRLNQPRSSGHHRAHGMVAGLTVVFGFGNVFNLALRCGVPSWVALLAGPGSIYRSSCTARLRWAIRRLGSALSTRSASGTQDRPGGCRRGDRCSGLPWPRPSACWVSGRHWTG